jgi:hypothetical protein
MNQTELQEQVGLTRDAWIAALDRYSALVHVSSEHYNAAEVRLARRDLDECQAAHQRAVAALDRAVVPPGVAMLDELDEVDELCRQALAGLDDQSLAQLGAMLSAVNIDLADLRKKLGQR